MLKQVFSIVFVEILCIFTLELKTTLKNLIMKLTTQNTSGTSFFHVTIKTTVNELIQAIGQPQYFENHGVDKVNVEWDCETSTGEVFTIYDWKQYRCLYQDEILVFHIGSHSLSTSHQALEELTSKLK